MDGAEHNRCVETPSGYRIGSLHNSSELKNSRFRVRLRPVGTIVYGRSLLEFLRLASHAESICVATRKEGGLAPRNSGGVTHIIESIVFFPLNWMQIA